MYIIFYDDRIKLNCTLGSTRNGNFSELESILFSGIQNFSGPFLKY